MSRGASLDELERLYRARFDEFARVAAAIAGPDRAGDAVHEAFVALVRTRGSFRREAPVEAWAWRAVVNAARKQARRGSDPEPTLARGDDPDLAHVRRAVASLPERQRLVLFLRYYADLDHETIANALEIRSGTVGATLHAAQATLKTQLEEVTAE